MRIREIAPPEVRGGIPRLVLTGNEALLIEGHTGLISYETKRVRVKSASGVVQVSGEGLTIDFFGADDVLIRGRVDDVSISGEG